MSPLPLPFPQFYYITDLWVLNLVLERGKKAGFTKDRAGTKDIQPLISMKTLVSLLTCPPSVGNCHGQGCCRTPPDKTLSSRRFSFCYLSIPADIPADKDYTSTELEYISPHCGPFFETHSGGNFYSKGYPVTPQPDAADPPPITIVLRRLKCMHSCYLQRLTHINLRLSTCFWYKQDPAKEIN